ncbi:MAG: preprotein translocase subunit SecE [Candidatus Pseudothioglobus sp.]|nr:preprotein translocase subunit SecE [Gammaproteobacteria bacterium]
MTKQIDNLKSGSDQWKTILAIAIVIAALALYYVNPLNFNTLTKVLITLLWFVIAGAVFIKSTQGDRFLHFLRETRIELRKVVWPTREETAKTTGIIMIAVVVVAIFLWIIDAFFTWGVQSISLLNIF